MRLIPVLDLRGGLAVHARGGARARYAPVESRLAPDARRGDAAAIAAAYAASGARSIYVADLDAIEGREPQESLVRACCAAAGSTTTVWIDAGIATPGVAARWLGMRGVERVIVGLETMPNMGCLADIVRAVEPGRVVFSVDLRNGVPEARDDALRRLSPVDLADAGVGAGAACVLLLDLARVGSGAGVDEALAREIARVSHRWSCWSGAVCRTRVPCTACPRWAWPVSWSPARCTTDGSAGERWRSTTLPPNGVAG